MSQVLYWWLFFWIQIIAYLSAGYLGIFEKILLADHTYLTFVIITIHIVANIYIGYLFNQKAKNKKPDTSIAWFISEATLTLGMIGTVIGLILMIGSSFTLIAADPQALKNIIGSIASGIGTALWTTLFGLIASACLKVQLVVLEKENVKR